MKKVIIIIASVIILIGGFYFLRGGQSKPAPAGPAGTSQKLADQSYVSSAYLISSDTLSADAKRALSGFQMDKKTMPDGTTQIMLKALEPQYHDQQYVLKPGEQLYFIDKFMGDDQGTTEANINDDFGVIVDSQGNVVGSPVTP